MNYLLKWLIKSKQSKQNELTLFDIKHKHIKTKKNKYKSKSFQYTSTSYLNLNNSNHSIISNNNNVITITKPNYFEILVTDTQNKNNNHKPKEKQNTFLYSNNNKYEIYSPSSLRLSTNNSQIKLKNLIKTLGDSEKISKKQDSKYKQSKSLRKSTQERLSQLISPNKRTEEKLNLIRQNEEEKFQLNHSFQPTLNSYHPRYISNLNSFGNSPLHLSFAERLQHYENIKKKNLTELQNDFSYKPPKPIRKGKDSIVIPLTDNYHELKKQKLNMIQQEIESEQGITFKPKLNDNKNKNIKDNVAQRNMKFLLNKEEKLLNGTYATTNNSDKECTFEPVLYTSNNINDKKKSNKNTTRSYLKTFDERLIDYQQMYESHKDQLRLKFEKNYSFMPQISKNTDMILNNKRIIEELIKKRTEEFEKKTSGRSDTISVDNNNNNSNNAPSSSEGNNFNLNSHSSEHIVINPVNSINSHKLSDKNINSNNEIFCPRSQEIQEISDEETNSIANYESKEIKINDKKTNLKNALYNPNKLKLTSESLTNDNTFQITKLKSSVDDSLEKFQMKYAEIMKKKENSPKDYNNNPISLNPKDHTRKNVVINRMEYYDNLD